MSFNYNDPYPTGHTALTPPSKSMQCKSYLIDLAATNRTTAVAFDLGVLPKDAQIVGGLAATTTAVSGAGPVTAATLQITANGASVYNSLNVFAIGTSVPNNAGYFNLGLNATTDQKIVATFTLTGGTVASGGRIYVNIYFVI